MWVKQLRALPNVPVSCAEQRQGWDGSTKVGTAPVLQENGCGNSLGCGDSTRKAVERDFWDVAGHVRS